MARMTLDDLLRQNIAGAQIWNPLAKQAGVADWQYSGGGNDDSGNALQLGIPDAQKLQALQGYTFDWSNSGPENTGTLTAYDPNGNPVGSFNQQDQSFGSALGEFAALAGAGFGGLALAGAGPLAGAFGGAGGAGQVGSSVAGAGGEAAANLAAYGGTLTPAQVAATAGLDIGAAGAAGAGIAGGGMTAPMLGAKAGLGAGLGTVGAAGGGAAGTSFWGGLAKAAIPAAISTGVQMIGANQAAKAQQAATNQANNLQKYVYDTTRQDNMPALQARNSALQQMQSLLSDPSTLTSQPGYQFGMDQGTRAVNNGAAARGMTYSGAAGKALTKFGQDYAGTKLNDSFNRLSALAGAGQPGAGTIAGAGSQYGQTVGNNLTAMGDANAAKYIVGGNAIGNAVNGLTAYGQRQGWWGG
jgi:hypothetical protein